MKKLIITILIILCLFGTIYSTYHIFIWQKSVNENKKIKEDINKKVNIFKHDDYDEYLIDFAYLKEQNSDTIAYLKVNNTNIDYIVVKGQDNDYYLTHNFIKGYSISGWIFMDFRNNFDDNDKNIIIYGHSTVDGSMFGSLKNVLDKSWQADINNHLITLINENETVYYEVFSTYTIIPEDYYIRTDFTNDEEYLSFLKEIKARSNYDYNVDLNENDSILTLSTCANNGHKRVVLHAKKIPE